MNTVLNRTHFRLIVALFFSAALIFVAGQLPQSAQAQDGETIQWGEAKLGQVTSAAGTLYNFQGVAEDTASIEVLGVGGFSPRVSILDANRNVLVQDDNAAASNTVNVSHTLTVDGLYYIQVNGLNDSVGQFTVSLNRGLPTGIPIPPPNSNTIQGVVSPEFPTVYYDFNPSPTDNTRIEIRSLTEGYSPVATVYASSGESIASVSSSRLVATALEFGPGTEPLKLAVQLGTFLTQADFEVIVIVVPPATSSSSVPSTSSCVLSSADGNDVNIRSGGSTNHPAVGVMPGGTTLGATGYNSANGGWYEVQMANGTYGWMASFVLTTTGDCATLPTKTYAAAPAGGGNNGGGNNGGGPAATEEPGGGNNGGGTPPTEEPGSPPPTEEPTEEPPTAQTAPPDGDPVYNFELNFKNNETRTVSDVISYPNGDTSDRVRYEVKGFDSVTFAAESTITLVCTGPGAENAKVHFGAGNGPGVPCNGATRTYNHGEFTAIGQFTIFLDSGSDAYVTWTAVVSARRG